MSADMSAFDEGHDGGRVGCNHAGGRCSEDVYVVETPRGFTESFDRGVIDTLERLGLIRHVRDGHVLEDGAGRGVGALHRFYGPHATTSEDVLAENVRRLRHQVQIRDEQIDALEVAERELSEWVQP